MRAILFAAALAVVTLTAAGCGDDGPKKYHVRGTATFKGLPIPLGTIYFDPDVQRKNDGPQGYAKIVNGKFDTATDGTPHVGGPHVVRIIGNDGKVANENPFGKALFDEQVEYHDLPKADSELNFAYPKAK